MSASDSTNTSNSEDVWFVDFDASNHMTSHEEWFHDLRSSDRPGYVETGDNTTHPIWHIDNVFSDKDGKNTCIKNVLHVPTIMKNLISISQIVEQGMQVRFNNGDYFIKKRANSLPGDGENAECLFSIQTR